MIVMPASFTSVDNTLGWEIEKAHSSGGEPHIGVAAKIEFNR